MPLLGISADAWAAFFGAVVGGGATLSAQALNDRSQRVAAQKTADDLAAATAILMQDDFWHFQSMLARAIDRCTWWKPSEHLEVQASVEDRKTVFAALPDGNTNSDAKSDTNIVASAQGWVDYLISCRTAVTGDAPPLDQDTVETMQMTFGFLEEGRRALAALARRPMTHFSESRVMGQLANCKTEADLLARRCPDCHAPSSTWSHAQQIV